MLLWLSLLFCFDCVLLWNEEKREKNKSHTHTLNGKKEKIPYELHLQTKHLKCSYLFGIFLKSIARCNRTEPNHGSQQPHAVVAQSNRHRTKPKQKHSRRQVGEEERSEKNLWANVSYFQSRFDTFFAGFISFLSGSNNIANGCCCCYSFTLTDKRKYWLERITTNSTTWFTFINARRHIVKESSRENLCDIHIEEAERPNDKIKSLDIRIDWWTCKTSLNTHLAFGVQSTIISSETENHRIKTGISQENARASTPIRVRFFSLRFHRSLMAS